MPFQPLHGSHRRSGLVVALAIACTAAAGCSTRQVVDPLAGSTAQRLVTYSLDQFVEELLEQPEIVAIAGDTVALGVHFLSGHPLTAYAERLIDAQLLLTHEIRVAEEGETSAAELDVFFNSLGTDNDEFGLSVPTLGITPGADSINILALDMYHGITEGYAVIRTGDAGGIEQTDRVLARIRRDNVSTPIIDFPINQLD